MNEASVAKNITNSILFVFFLWIFLPLTISFIKVRESWYVVQYPGKSIFPIIYTQYAYFVS